MMAAIHPAGTCASHWIHQYGECNEAEGRTFAREGEAPDGRDFRLGEAKPSMAWRAQARHVLPQNQ
jgi:hypothetical protein